MRSTGGADADDAGGADADDRHTGGWRIVAHRAFLSEEVVVMVMIITVDL